MCIYILSFHEHDNSHFDISIDDLQLEMAYAFCDELRSAQPLSFQPSFLGTFYTSTFHHLDFDTKVELNMFFTIIVVMVEKVKM